jgi:PAS domain S-box-containing protein
MKIHAPASIRTQLILLVLITLVPATAIIVVKDVRQRDQAVRDAEEEATELVQNLAANQDLSGENARRMLMTLSQVNDVRNRNVAACDTLFTSLLRDNNQYINLILIDPRGTIIAAATKNKNVDVADRKFFQEAVNTKKFSVGEYVVSRITKKPAFHFSYPLLDENNNVTLVLAVALNLERWNELFARAQLPDETEMILSDWRGVILHAKPNKMQIGAREEDSVLAAMQRSVPSSGLFQAKENGVDFLNAFQRVYLHETGEMYMHVRVSVNKDVALAGARRSMVLNLGLISLVYLIALSMAWVFGDRWIVRKLRLAVDAAGKIAAGVLDAGAAIPHTHGELGALFRSFDEMSSALRKRDEESHDARMMLQETGERYRMLFDHIPQPLIVMDEAANRILTVNSAAVFQYGYSREEFLLLTYHELMAEEPALRVLKAIRHGSVNEASIGGFKKHVKKNGEVMDVDVKCESLTYRGVPSMMVSVTDVTERFRGEKIQQALYKIYRASNMAGNLQELFVMIHRILGEIVPAQNFSIALHDAEQDTMSYPYFVDEYEVTPLPQKSGKGVAAYVLRTGEPLIATQETVQVLATEGEIETASFAGLEWLGAPLKVDDRSIGVVALRTYDERVRFKEKDKIFLLFISSQIAKAIDLKRADDALRESERKLRRSQTSLTEAQALATLGSWHKDLITGITSWSETMFTIFGLSPLRPVPHSDEFYTIVHPDDVPQVRAAIVSTMAGTTTQLDYRIVIRGGEIRHVTSMTKPTFDQHHTVVEILGTILDITDRKVAEEQIRRSLREKEVLLKEIHHRVKNNMQIISSMLNLQAAASGDSVAREILQESQQRVRSMALIHEHLYQSDNFSEIDLNDYIRSIVLHLIHTYDREDIASELSIAPLRLNLDTAIPCGLIVNELVSNALKYAFPSGRRGTISVSIAVVDDHTVHLDVVDDGVGLSVPVSIESVQTLGLQLVHSLVQQLQGSVAITAANGTRAHIQICH